MGDQDDGCFEVLLYYIDYNPETSGYEIGLLTLDQPPPRVHSARSLWRTQLQEKGPPLPVSRGEASFQGGMPFP